MQGPRLPDHHRSPFAGASVDQLDLKHLSAGDSGLTLTGKRCPALVSDVAIERCLRGELQDLDLQGPAIGAVRARSLEDPCTVIPQQLQDLALVSDELSLGARVRPEQDA